MKSKVFVVTEKPLEYPVLRACTNDLESGDKNPLVVMFVSEFKGIIVSNHTMHADWGKFADDWPSAESSYWTKFQGEIVLSND